MNSKTEAAIDRNWWTSWCAGNVVDTRQKILLAAFKEIHFHGYQAASIQNIIDQVGVTKGALYHHFKSKHEMLLALLEEVHAQYVENTFIKPMENTDDPITVLSNTLYALKEKMSDEDVALGCPLDSLAQEMAPIDKEVQVIVDRLYQRKQQVMTKAFERGQAAGNVSTDLSAESIALMIRATLQGCMGIAKSARSVDALIQCGTAMIHYLEQLRPDSSSGE